MRKNNESLWSCNDCQRVINLVISSLWMGVLAVKFRDDFIFNKIIDSPLLLIQVYNVSYYVQIDRCCADCKHWMDDRVPPLANICLLFFNVKKINLISLFFCKMSKTHQQVLYTNEQQRQAILSNNELSRPPHQQPAAKTLSSLFLDNLDKILAAILIALLLFFFLHSSSSDYKKRSITKQALLGIQQQQVPVGQLTKPSTNQKNKQSPQSPQSAFGKDTKSALKQLMHESQVQSATQQGDDFDKQLSKMLKNKHTKKKEHNEDENEDNNKDNNMAEVYKEDDDGQLIAPKQNTKPQKKDQSDDLEDDKSLQAKLQQTKYLPHRRRNQFFKQKERVDNLEYLKLAKFNLIYPGLDEEEREILLEEERKRLEEKYKISEFQEELSVCVVAHASTHKKAYSHQYLLNSILSQQYEHFTVVYVADGFTTQEVQTVKQFIKKRDLDKRVTFVWNNQKKYFLESTVTAIKAFCMEKRVTVLLDGDDQLLGTQVFKLLNTFYRRHSANLIYGNFVEFHQEQQQLRVGFSTQYQDSQKRDNNYRSIGQKFGSIKTFKTRLISFIKQADLKDTFGNYYRYAGDYALMYPLLQLSCGQVRYMPEYNYLYFGYEIDPTYGSMQIANGRAIRERARYDCFKKYK